MEKVVSWNNTNITVVLSSKDSYITQLNYCFQSYIDKFNTEGHPYPLYEDRPTTLEDMEVEERKFKEFISLLCKTPSSNSERVREGM